jgi:dTDP-4-amino-4,6-dideoxygalactose transaminase
MRIPVAKPSFDRREMQAVLDPITSGWVSQGPKVQEFEGRFRAYVGTAYASSVNSGSAALHVALIACGIRPGDEVITSAFTCCAAVNPIEYVGAKPVIVDIDLATFSLDPHQLEKAVTDRTRAIIPVHLFGLSADMDPIMRIARKHRLKVIEDGALGLGAFYKGRHVGGFGNAGIFSFHPRKMIATGEGGMVVTNDERIDRKVKVLRNYGASVSAWDRHRSGVHVFPSYEVLGFNYKMSDLHASLGAVQVQKLPTILEKRRRLAERYDKDLGAVDWLITPSEPSGRTHGYQSYVCLFNPGDVVHRLGSASMRVAHRKRNDLMEFLAQRGIATVGGAQAVPMISYYRRKYAMDKAACPNAVAAELLSIALPIYPDLSFEKQKYIIKNIRAFHPH